MRITTMITTVDSHATYIPFPSISCEESAFRFHLSHGPAVEAIRASLLKSGQTHPVILQSAGNEKFRVVDGHRRLEAIRLIRESGGSWDKVWSHVLPEDPAPLDLFRLIREKNDLSDQRYGIYERGFLFKQFSQNGLDIPTMAQECSLTVHAVEDHIELTAAHPALAAELNNIDMEPVYALMLHHRFEGWMKTHLADKALPVAKRLLKHARQEKLTIKSWRFLLDFYWSKDRLFLNGAVQ